MRETHEHPGFSTEPLSFTLDSQKEQHPPMHQLIKSHTFPLPHALTIVPLHYHPLLASSHSELFNIISSSVTSRAYLKPTPLPLLLPSQIQIPSNFQTPFLITTALFSTPQKEKKKHEHKCFLHHSHLSITSAIFSIPSNSKKLCL